MMKITTEDQDEALDKIDDLLSKITLSNEEKSLFPKELKDKTEDINRTIKRDLNQFKSSTSIVIVVGMLKSGKSTLVNLLARNTNASPVGFGVDTTMRPALIKMENPGSTSQGGIDIYSPTQTESSLESGTTEGATEQTNEEREKGYDYMLQWLIDELRNIKREGKAPYTIRSRELNEKELRRVLCEKEGKGTLSSEPLLVVIRLPYDEKARLLAQGSYLMDMPGVDSGDASISYFTEGKYNKFVKECDMVLCLQSSVAPLNKTAQDCFKDILKTRNNATVCVIQNNMVHKPWLTKKEIEKEEDEQRDRAVNLIRDVSKNCKVRGVNLGEAFAVLLQDEKALRLGEEMPDKTKIEKGLESEFYKNSQFEELENDIIDFIHKEGNTTRFRNCKEALKRDVETFIEELEAYKKKCETAKENLVKRQNAYTRIQKYVDNQCGKSYEFSQGTKVHCDSDALRSKLQKSVKLDDFQKDGTGEAKGSVIDKNISEYIEKCKEKAEELLKSIQVGDLKVERGGKSSWLSDELKEEAQDIVNDMRVREKIESNAELPKEEKDEFINKLKKCEAVATKKSFPVELRTGIKTVEAPQKYETRWRGKDNMLIKYWLPWEMSQPLCNTNKDRDMIVNRYVAQIESLFEAGKKEWLNSLLRECIQDSLQEIRVLLGRKSESMKGEIDDINTHKNKVDGIFNTLNSVENVINDELK